MTQISGPAQRPAAPFFSSGPCRKYPGWSLKQLENAVLGRSHRSEPGKARLQNAIAMTKKLLRLPETHQVAIVPASDTGAVEMALWSLLGPRPVDVLVWESFGKGWATDIRDQLNCDTRILDAPYGQLPDLTSVDCDHDIVFAWNGTTSGVRVPNGDWISDDRGGLTICDATSAAFAQPLPFDKLDVVTFSWQKVLGGEAAHGMIIMGPRAISRLETYDPPWPMPKIFRLKKSGMVNNAIFAGATINTPSMLCVEDYLAALTWAESIGGADALHARADTNLAEISDWVDRTDWVGFLAERADIRSNSSVCLKIIDRDITQLGAEGQRAFTKHMSAWLAQQDIAYDINAYRDAPPGLRIWAGATVERSDINALLPWLDVAFFKARDTFVPKTSATSTPR